MGNTGTTCSREVTAYEVIGNLVVIGTCVQGKAAAGTVKTAIFRDGIVMYAHIVVLGIRILDLVALNRSEHRVTQPHTTGVERTVIENAVIGNLHEIGIAVQNNSAARIGTRDGEAVYTRSLVHKLTKSTGTI